MLRGLVVRISACALLLASTSSIGIEGAQSQADGHIEGVALAGNMSLSMAAVGLLGTLLVGFGGEPKTDIASESAPTAASTEEESPTIEGLSTTTEISAGF